jgi:hypothetical protein
MNVSMLLRAARAAGVEVYANSGRLVVRGPRLADPLARELLERKAKVLPFRQEPSHLLLPSGPSQADGLLQMSLAQFYSAGELIEWAVDWLEASLWFVPNAADVETLAREGVSRGHIWTALELMDVLGIPHLPAEEITTLAAVKREFGGQVIKARPRGERCGERGRGGGTSAGVSTRRDRTGEGSSGGAGHIP